MKENDTTSTVLVTGASTGIGNLTARALSAAGHTVYASMRDPSGRNAKAAGDLREAPKGEGGELRVVELDVTSQDSADAAVGNVIDEAGGLDVVVNNAGHLYVGYMEAFTAGDIAHLLDINVLGAHRVNRAALPHMRERGRGPCCTSAAPSPSPRRRFSTPTSPLRRPSTLWP